MLQVTPSTYHEQEAKERDASRFPARARRDPQLKPEIYRVWQENLGVYSARKVLRQLLREGLDVARADARDRASKRRARPSPTIDCFRKGLDV